MGVGPKGRQQNITRIACFLSFVALAPQGLLLEFPWLALAPFSLQFEGSWNPFCFILYNVGIRYKSHVWIHFPTRLLQHFLTLSCDIWLLSFRPSCRPNSVRATCTYTSHHFQIIPEYTTRLLFIMQWCSTWLLFILQPWRYTQRVLSSGHIALITLKGFCKILSDCICLSMVMFFNLFPIYFQCLHMITQRCSTACQQLNDKRTICVYS